MDTSTPAAVKAKSTAATDDIFEIATQKVNAEVDAAETEMFEAADPPREVLRPIQNVNQVTTQVPDLCVNQPMKRLASNVLSQPTNTMQWSIAARLPSHEIEAYEEEQAKRKAVNEKRSKHTKKTKFLLAISSELDMEDDDFELDIGVQKQTVVPAKGAGKKQKRTCSSAKKSVSIQQPSSVARKSNESGDYFVEFFYSFFPLHFFASTLLFVLCKFELPL